MSFRSTRRIVARAAAKPLTAGELRALQVVAAGHVRRVYSVRGNVLVGPGISSAVLWRLDARGVLYDGEQITSRAYRVALNKQGRSLLAGKSVVE